jgi:spore maturation protein SpmA
MKTVMFLSLINLVVCAAIVCLMPFVMAYAPETFTQHATTLFLTTLLASFVGLGALVVICDR